MAEKIKEEKAKAPKKGKSLDKPVEVKPVEKENTLAAAPAAEDEIIVEQGPSEEIVKKDVEIPDEVVSAEDSSDDEAKKPLDEDENSPKKDREIIVNEEEVPDEGGELGAAAPQQAEDEEIEAEFDDEDHPHMEITEETIVSGPAEIATLNPNLPADKSKWVARLVAEKGYHILFKGSFAKAYRVADNYNRIHGFPANKVRRVRN